MDVQGSEGGTTSLGSVHNEARGHKGDMGSFWKAVCVRVQGRLSKDQVECGKEA